VPTLFSSVDYCDLFTRLMRSLRILLQRFLVLTCFIHVAYTIGTFIN